MNDNQVLNLVMKEYDRMGVPGAQLFSKIELDDQTRIKRRIDLPQVVYIPQGLEPDDHLKCSDARTFGRFPTLTYFNRQLGYSLWRSSSQSFDPTTKRSQEDEKFMAAINRNAENPN